MCGIIGYTGFQQAAPILLEGLGRLEYRGYDSAGIAVSIPDGEVSVRKAAGKLSVLLAQLEGQPPKGTTGLGHTRWATHGRPSDANAHPHTDCRGEVVVIHNGIVENHGELKRELEDRGHRFISQTDTETLCHLIESALDDGVEMEEAVRQTAQRLRGANVFIALCRRWSDLLVAVRLGNAGGLLVGYGQKEMLLASDLSALLPTTRRVAFLGDREIVSLRPEGARYSTLAGEPLQVEPMVVPLDPVAAAKGGYRHFMLKEIFEQPQSIMDTFRRQVLLDSPEILLEDLPFTAQQLREVDRVVLVGMGSALHAAMVGKYLLETLSHLPTEVDNASEFRYREPVIGPHTLVIAISQSGETADTLAAMEEARRQRALLLALTNTIGSQATRLAQGVILTQCGLEIGVAATKTLMGQMAALYLLALHLAVQRGHLSREELAQRLEELARIPNLVGSLLQPLSEQCERLAGRYYRYNNFLYLGRGIQYPIALEGALKLKEISYIHAEGYAAGEMKHGAIALVDNDLPIVAIALRDRLYEKILSNIEQVIARQGVVIAITDEGNHELDSKVSDVLTVPWASELLNPFLTLLPLQFLAYHIAVRRGLDVDQPRNLAKSVTVE